MCNYEFAVWDSPQANNSMNLNQCAVAGTIRCVNKGTYSRMLPNVTQGFTEAEKKAMEDAGIEEAELATQRGDLIDEVPYITVVIDGSWMKRSYRTGKYDSLSGISVIIRYCTGKVFLLAYEINTALSVIAVQMKGKSRQNIFVTKTGTLHEVRLAWKRML